MPFVEDPDVDGLANGGDVPFPHIGTDLLEDATDDEEPLDSGPIDFEALQGAATETAAAEDDEFEQGNGAGEQESDDEDDDDEDIPTAEEVPAPSTAKKRGRPSLGASRTSTPKTPKSSAPVGRKRKSDNSTEEPAAKRPGRGRATAAAASEAIKQATAKRPRAAPGTSKAAPKATGAKRGPKPGKAKKEAKEEEYEVEKILEHAGSGNSTKYLVKWKGYGKSDNTWEPKSNLAHAADLLKEYNATAKEEKTVAPVKKITGPAKQKPGPKKAPAAATKKAALVKKAAAAAKPAGRAGRRGRPRKQ